MSMQDEMPVSTTEQRLRDAFAAAAQTVAPVAIRLPRPEDAPEHVWDRRSARAWRRHRPRSFERRRRLPRLCEQVLIPLAAAATLALVVTALSVVVPRAFSAGLGTHHAHTAGRPAGAVRASELAAGYPGRHLPSGASPRYFVGIRELSGATPANPVFATALAVYSAATGQVVASLGQPGKGRYYQAVAALGSDTTFVAAAVPARGPDCHTWFYRFSLGPQGQPTAWEPLSVPEVTGQIRYNNALAASANGNVIAYSAATCAQNYSSQVGVIHLDTGKVTTWSTLWPAMPRNLSLSADGTLLSFVGNPSSGTEGASPAKDAAWTLYTGATAGPVARHYRKVVHAPGGVQSATLSPTGAIMFAMTPTHLRSRTVTDPDVSAYDTATGKLLGLVQTVRYASENPGFSSDASGQYVLVYPAGMPFIQKLNLITRQLRTIPVASADNPVAVAW